MNKFFFRDNRILIKFFQWLYFPGKNDYRIIKLKGFNVFLCDKPSGRATVSPIWDKKRIVALYKRFLKKE